MTVAKQKALFDKVPHCNGCYRGSQDDGDQKEPRITCEPTELHEALNNGEMQYVHSIGKITISSEVADVQEQCEEDDNCGEREWLKKG
jgi:hypothetical protein